MKPKTHLPTIKQWFSDETGSNYIKTKVIKTTRCYTWISEIRFTQAPAHQLVFKKWQPNGSIRILLMHDVENNVLSSMSCPSERIRIQYRNLWGRKTIKCSWLTLRALMKFISILWTNGVKKPDAFFWDLVSTHTRYCCVCGDGKIIPYS